MEPDPRGSLSCPPEARQLGVKPAPQPVISACKCRANRPSMTPLRDKAMSAPTSDFLSVLTERGYIHQCSDLEGLDAKAHTGGLIAYVGYDCTAPSLHVGHLLSIMMLHWLQQTGGKPFALMGGGTTRVGDPSGRDESRRLLTLEQIGANKGSIRGTFSRFIRFGEGGADALMV